MKYIISFDITDDKRRSKVVKTLLSYAYRVQKSVFEGHFSKDEILTLKNKLTDYIDSAEDSIRYYLLCKDCDGKIGIEGKGKLIEELKYIVI